MAVKRETGPQVTNPDGFTDDQVKLLIAKMDPANVKKTPKGMDYIEGWKDIDVANQIFGFDGWNREIVSLVMVGDPYKAGQKDSWRVGYRCTVRITVTAGQRTVYRDGTGYGSGIMPDANDAHEKAVKEAECVPLSTKILTQDGFKHFSELAIGELVAGYDLEKQHLVWTPVHDVVKYDDAPVVRIHNPRTFDVTCTPDHDWVSRTSSGKPMKMAFRDMNTRDAILCAAPMLDQGSLPATPDEAARIGFAICDGTFHRTTKGKFCRFGIYQSKPETVEWCRQMYGPFANERARNLAVGELPNGGSRANCLQAYVWEVAAEHSQAWLSACGVSEPEDLPKTVAKLSPAARQAMLDAMMAADGTERGVFAKKRKPFVMEVLRILSALQGVYTGVTRMAAHDMPTVRLQKHAVVTAWNCKSEDAGRMAVWCPKTGTGTWVAQFENGVTTITGNTDAMKRALMTFGYPFGLALYDKLKENVMTPEEKYAEDERQFAAVFAADLADKVHAAGSVAALGAVYEAAKETLARVKRGDPDTYRFLTEMIKTAKDVLLKAEAPPAEPEAEAPAEPAEAAAELAAPPPEPDKKPAKAKTKDKPAPEPEPEPAPPPADTGTSVHAMLNALRTGIPPNPVADDFELPASLQFNPNAPVFKLADNPRVTDWPKWARACIDNGIKMIEDETILDVWEARHQKAIDQMASLTVAGHNKDGDPISGDAIAAVLAKAIDAQRKLLQAIAAGTSYPLIWNKDNKPGSVIHYLTANEWAKAFSAMANHPAQFGATFLNVEMVKRLMAEHKDEDLGKVISAAVSVADKQEKARKAAQSAA